MLLFGVGMAKSGTVTVAAMFGKYRSAHEPWAARMLAGIFGGRDLRKVVLDKQAALDLEVDSSQLNFPALDILLDEFPQARFLLTVREPVDWARSLVNHILTRPCGPDWSRYRDMRFGGGQRRPGEDHLPYSLAGMFGYWQRHNLAVLEKVPPDRLLVVRTDRLNERIGDIAAFAGVPAETLVPSHGNRGQYDRDPLGLPDDHVAEQLDRHCPARAEILGMG